MARGPDALFYGFTGIINRRFTDQSDHAYYLSYFIKLCNVSQFRL